MSVFSYISRYEDFVDIFGSSQNWTSIRGHFLYFRVMYRMGIFFRLQKFQMYFFLGGGVDRV